MSLNQFMHPRNPYRKAPNFKELSEKYSYFKEQIKTDDKGGIHLNFKEPDSLRALSRVLLEHDFSLKVDLPDGRLVPAIPLRLNYLLYIEDILTLNNRVTDIKGIDIGTGASCVYPMLAARTKQWKFLATEINEFSSDCAKRNVSSNHLDHMIIGYVLDNCPWIVQWIDNNSDSILNEDVLEEVIFPTLESKGNDDALIISPTSINESDPDKATEVQAPPISNSSEEDRSLFDFCICNPPFYSSNLDAWGMMEEPRKKRRKLNVQQDCEDEGIFNEEESVDRPPPHSVNTAAPNEAVTVGGEVAFVGRLIEDSLHIRNKIRFQLEFYK